MINYKDLKKAQKEGKDIDIQRNSASSFKIGEMIGAMTNQFDISNMKIGMVGMDTQLIDGYGTYKNIKIKIVDNCKEFNY